MSGQNPSLLKMQYLVDWISFKEYVFSGTLIKFKCYVIKCSLLYLHTARRSLALSKNIFVLEFPSSGLVPAYSVDEQELARSFAFLDYAVNWEAILNDWLLFEIKVHQDADSRSDNKNNVVGYEAVEYFTVWNVFIQRLLPALISFQEKMQSGLVLSCLDKYSWIRVFDRVMFWAKFLAQKKALVAGSWHLEHLCLSSCLCSKFTFMELDTVIFLFTDENELVGCLQVCYLWDLIYHLFWN